MTIKTVFVAGGGLMGYGIAHAVATGAKLPVYIYDLNDEILSKTKARIEKVFSRAEQKGLMSADDINAARERIHYTTKLEDAANARRNAAL